LTLLGAQIVSDLLPDPGSHPFLKSGTHATTIVDGSPLAGGPWRISEGPLVVDGRRGTGRSGWIEVAACMVG
jgi:hypothetical protein